MGHYDSCYEGDRIAHVETETKAIKKRVKKAMGKMDLVDLEFVDNIIGNLDGYRLFFHVLNSNKL